MNNIFVVLVAAAADLFATIASFPVVRSTRVDTSGRVRTSFDARLREKPAYYVTPHLHTLVGSLVDAGILDDANGTNCFVLDNITREWHSPEDGVSAIQVSLQIRQFRVPEGTRRFPGAVGRGKGKPLSSAENSVMEDNGSCLEILTRTTATSTTTLVSLTQGYRGSSDAENASAASNIGERNRSSPGSEDTKAKPKQKEEEHTGLNKRQILVISTCSTVIGAFFVTAFILRIRNYMKRSKQDKDGARRHMRAASMPHQRTHHGSLDHFATSDNTRRWSHFNPFNTDR